MKKVCLALSFAILVSLILLRAPVMAETSLTDPGATTTEPSVTPKPTSTVGTNRDALNQQRIQNLQLKTADLQAARAKEATRTADRCTLIGQKIDKALSNYQNNRTTQINLYKAMADKIQQILLKLQQAGIDVTALQADLQQYNVKIQQLNTDAAAAMAQLQVAKQYECGNSQGQFMTELGKARTLMQTVEKDAQDVRSYFQGTIRPDIEKLRSQIKTTHLETHVPGSPKPIPSGITNSSLSHELKPTTTTNQQ